MLYAVFVSLIFWLVGQTWMERQIVDERMKKVTDPVGWRLGRKGAIFKPEFVGEKGALKNMFAFRVAPSLQQVTVFIVICGAVSTVIFLKLQAPIFSKAVLAMAFSIVALRFLRSVAERRRVDLMRNELPGAMDLMVICLEAGLGINSAFLRVSNEMEGTPLGEELKQTFNEVSAGVPLDSALRNFAKRAKIAELNAIVVAIIQAQKMGTALAATFRIQAESLREQYKMRMKEKIMKMPIKILFPLVFFIFPVLFLVILGPAAIAIYKQFIQGGL